MVFIISVVEIAILHVSVYLRTPQFQNAFTKDGEIISKEFDLRCSPNKAKVIPYIKMDKILEVLILEFWVVLHLQMPALVRRASTLSSIGNKLIKGQRSRS